MTFSDVLFPGRHHAITAFQVDFLQRLLAGRIVHAGEPVIMATDAVVIWPVTSANHAGTRRNPLPGHRREALIERISATEGLAGLVVPVPDVPHHPRFAELVLTTVATVLSHRSAPDPERTVVACSTPEVAASYRELGYTVIGVEDAAGTPNEPARPWEVIERLGMGDESWREIAHPQTVAHFERYGVAALVAELFTDPVVSS